MRKRYLINKKRKQRSLSSLEPTQGFRKGWKLPGSVREKSQDGRRGDQ
jgi:hypothetical protein